MIRFQSLDWLRGMLAVSIMIYHLNCWIYYEPDSSELIGRLGIYGVSMFFIVSGLTMAGVYSGFIHNWEAIIKFYIRRIFRIWPLLWVAIAVVLMGNIFIKGLTIDWRQLLLNLSTAFGFFAPGDYINTGAWSIGNEMVYYSITPLLLNIYNKSKRLGNIIFLISIIIGIIFSFQLLNVNESLATQWNIYINPLNNLVLYIAGIYLFYNFKDVKFKLITINILLLLSIIFLIFYPVEGDLITTVSGFNRIIFSAISICIVLSFYKMTYVPHRWIERPLALVGVATYGIYLLHPIVYPAIKIMSHKLFYLSSIWLMIFTTLFTILLSIFVHKYFEFPFIKIGKRFSNAIFKNLN